MSGEIDALFRRYAELYMAGDADAVVDMYHIPFYAIRDGTSLQLPDRPAVIEHTTELMAAFRDAGAASADIGGLDVRSQGDSATLATVRWLVRSAAGDVIRDFQTSYQLIGPAPWRIASYVNHDTVKA
jgi:ketosteroid isomerase-like protein